MTIEITDSGNTQPNLPKPMMSAGTYDTLKKVVQIVLPAASALYFSLSQIWGLPGAEQVMGTLAVLATFCGVLLGLSKRAYNASGAQFDGQMVTMIDGESGKKTYLLELNGDPENLDKQKIVSFKVEPLPNTL